MYDANQSPDPATRDPYLADQFAAVMKAGELWPTIQSEGETYRAQRDAVAREASLLVSDVTAWLANVTRYTR
jgi:hypothetical protein